MYRKIYSHANSIRVLMMMMTLLTATRSQLRMELQDLQFVSFSIICNSPVLHNL